MDRVTELILCGMLGGQANDIWGVLFQAPSRELEVWGLP